VARILMIAYSTYICDGRVKRHAEALVERGDTVDVICLDPGQPMEPSGVNILGVPIPRYRGGSRSRYALSYLSFFSAAVWMAARLSARRPYDLVIVCSIPDAAVLCAVPLKLFGSKVLLDIHDTMPELYQEKFGGRRGALGARLLMFEERASAWFADKVLAVHDPHARRLRNSGISPDKIDVVLNSPDPRLFPTRQNSRAHALCTPFTLITHGTIGRRLGLDTAIEAVSILRDRIPGVRLRVLGIGDYLHKARSHAARQRLTDRVSFEDRVPIECLSSALEQASVGLVPNDASCATHLMLPVKLLEYATLGIPIISARLRTIEHYFDDDAVRYFEPGDPASLAKAIEDLYSHPERRHALANRASEVAASLSWPRQRQQYYATIDSLLAPNGA
jgi:glycosyltransferase involved in cell wall biosynthesis